MDQMIKKYASFYNDSGPLLHPPLWANIDPYLGGKKALEGEGPLFAPRFLSRGDCVCPLGVEHMIKITGLLGSNFQTYNCLTRLTGPRLRFITGSPLKIVAACREKVFQLLRLADRKVRS
jgi:hypothetical protein